MSKNLYIFGSCLPLQHCLQSKAVRESVISATAFEAFQCGFVQDDRAGGAYWAHLRPARLPRIYSCTVFGQCTTLYILLEPVRCSNGRLSHFLAYGHRGTLPRVWHLVNR